jgi:hypothetical protein
LVVFEATNGAIFLPQKGRVVIRQARFDPSGSKLRAKQGLAGLAVINRFQPVAATRQFCGDGSALVWRKSHPLGDLWQSTVTAQAEA